ncbi:MAG TPA: molybdopterin-synthase adenylyltransferase MoeB [Acidimicrobiales bacterium]|nr:molybdopterin-synthase adenylyltransferase MoeB [Acidimicrobiales bacterium]
MPPTLTQSQRERYHRHLLLPEVGVEGQEKLLASRALVIGAGGLGSPIALYLVAAGVGTLGIVDMDTIEVSNLQRQVLHTTDRVGERKVSSAQKTLAALDPGIEIVPYDLRLDAGNVLDILSGYDVVIMGVDNFPARYLVNDASLKLGVPVVHGGIFRFEGHVSVCIPYRGPCYRCMVREPPPSELLPPGGPLGVVPGVIGCIQATEAIKLLLGVGEPLVGRLIAYDSLAGEFRTFRLKRDPRCPACSVPREVLVVSEYDQLCLPHEPPSPTLVSA